MHTTHTDTSIVVTVVEFQWKNCEVSSQSFAVWILYYASMVVTVVEFQCKNCGVSSQPFAFSIL